MARSVLLALAGLALLLPACAGAGPEDDLAALYRASEDDPGGGSPADQAETEARRNARIVRVRELLEQATALSGEERLFAAAVLLDSDELSDLALAEDLALSAAGAGDDRGFPLAAEAIDRQCLMLGQPQRYGTQYLWAAGSWTLYPTDPATSDAERRAMGLPDLAAARARAAELRSPD